MNNTKLTILYERLSREDERENESVSIENQKDYLEEYAVKNGFTNVIHLTDDGWSGTRWDRPGFIKMMEKVENGIVQVILIKDMSRLGRDHLRVGLFLEKLREKGVRFIAAAEAIDTAKGEDDFMPFRNIFAEWHARDTSRKIRTIFGARTAQGKHVTGAVPYGYLHDPHDRQKWILDEDAAPIVKRIYRSIIEGKTMATIAAELTEEKVLIPSAHWEKVGAGMRTCPKANPTKWSITTVIAILKKEEYMGWAVLNKTVKETYKSKRKQAAPEDRLIFKDAHPAIVDEETWTIVQRLRQTRRCRESVGGDPNPLTGILYCADCGHKMYHKKGKASSWRNPHDEYVCSSYGHYSRSCTYHYIKVKVIQDLILTAIRRVSKYVRENESEFVERLREESAVQQTAAIKDTHKKCSKAKRRLIEVGSLIKKLYESYASEKIPEKHFVELLDGYDAEQEALEKAIAEWEAAIENYNSDIVKADNFIHLVKRHTEFSELTPTMLNEFVEKVFIHEAEKVDGVRTMEVEIFLNFIGRFDVPDVEEIQEEVHPPKKKRKPRRLMTDEEVALLREKDHQRYAKKVAAKKEALAAERASVLQGTSYEQLLSEQEIAS